MNNFEAFFRRFVGRIGGQALPEHDSESADFFFPTDRVIAELKTLQKDARLEHARKLQELVNDWTTRGLIRIYGRVQLSMRTLPAIPQREWLQMMQAPIETIIRKANRQIRSTKESDNLHSSKGVLLIANDGNFLHTEPVEYMGLVARVLAKKEPNGNPRFPHIDGVVYFSYRIPSRNEGLPFWVAGQMKPQDAQPREFQDRLRTNWSSQVRLRGMTRSS
jgi:hypothetical protein